MNRYIDAEKLKAEIERRRLSNRYIDTEDYEKELLEIITFLQQEQPEVELEEEITDKSRACCNCVNGILRYHNCLCWQHKYCNTDEPYKIPKEDWVETAKTCKEFEFEPGLNARKEE